MFVSLATLVRSFLLFRSFLMDLTDARRKNIEDDLENYRSFVRTVHSYYLYSLRACFRMAHPNVPPRTFSF